MRFNSFLKECQDKEVFKKLSIYAVFSWLFIQVVSVLQLPMGLPPMVVTYALILLLIGFPIYIFYIWKFQIAPIHKQELLANGTASSKWSFFGSKTPFQRYYFLSIFVISSLVSLVLFFVIRNNFLKETSEFEQITSLDLKSSDKIGVLKFGNNTGKDSLDIIGKMAADWIIHGITNKNLAQVVSPQVVEDYTNIIKERLNLEEKANVLQDYFKPARIISGNYYLSNGKLIFQCSITDGKLDKTLISLEPVSCSSKNPLDCIEELKQRILGYLITVENEKTTLQETPPIFEAYEMFLEAKTTSMSNEEYIRLVDGAIALDPDYFEPRTFQIAYYYDQGDYVKADSLLHTISKKYKLDKRQENIIQIYSSFLDGNNRQLYRHMKNEYDIAPFDLNTNVSMLAIALQYVNKPEVIDTVFNVINTKDSDAETCYYCSDRIFIKTLADLALKRYDSVVSYAKPIYKFDGQLGFLKPLTVAYLNLNKNPLELLNEPGLRLTREERSDFLLYAGTQSLIYKDQKTANTYFDALLTLNAAAIADYKVAQAHYYKKEYPAAIKHFENLKKEDSLNTDVISFLANSYALNNDLDAAQKELNLLESLRDTYQFGEIDYLLARYYAVFKEDTKSLGYLKKSVAAGARYTISSYQYDPHFSPYLKTPEFKNIMTYWH